MSSDGHFMYFAYGSNLLKERLQLKNPSATFYSTGRLKDYILRFGLWGERVQCQWNGGVATIEERPDAEVWGVVWRLSNDNLASLDKQEEVYIPLEVAVETESGLLVCRTYQMNSFSACLPSTQYKQVLCLGAQQNGLPLQYIKTLQDIETNNYSGPSSIMDEIKTVMT
ncbi:hypothetical protein ACEWY4_024448 [Coilia grayii]|uniref:Gamma-glutamylcyclotransferase n=1 Tax=Coilia grayii TaxID=363190 RepID=A0ABD1J2Z2_9TELE